MTSEIKRAYKEGRSRYLDGNICIDVLLGLNTEELFIQKKEYPKRFSSALTHLSNKIRKVVIHRGSNGGLGLSIKGGAEHGLPILVSRVLNKDFGNGEDSLHVGDAIVEVNGENVQSLSHESVVSMLKCAGDRIELKVKFYQPAFQYLTLQRGSLSRSSPGTNEDAADTSPTPSVDTFEKRWITFKNLPLRACQVLRANENEDNTLLVISGSDQIKLQFDDFETFSGWLRDLQKAVTLATKTFILQMNKELPAEKHIIIITWIDEEREGQMTDPRNVSIKDEFLFISNQAPANLNDWDACEESHKICECLLVKTDELRVTMKHLNSPTRTLIFRSDDEFNEFLKAWYSRNYFSVSQLKTKKLKVLIEGNSGYLNLDFESSSMSFVAPDTKKNVWSMKLHQIKGYHKYNNSRILMETWNESRTELDEKVLSCLDVNEVLCFLHSFMTASVASLDPMFLMFYDL